MLFSSPLLDSLKDELKRRRPRAIEDLWRSEACLCRDDVHLASENMDWWVTEEEVTDLLNDEERLRRLADELKLAAADCGLEAMKIVIQESGVSGSCDGVLVSPRCDGCNTVYDNGSCKHAESPTRVPMLDPGVNAIVHRVLIIISVATFLVIQEQTDGTDKLVRILAPKQSSGLPRNATLDHVPVLAALAGILEDCSLVFPKVSHLAVGLVSSLICLRPSAALSELDGPSFLRGLWNYLRGVDLLIGDDQCSGERFYGVVAFLNILPCLYHFGNWKLAASSPLFNAMIGGILTIMATICRLVTRGDGEEAIDDEPRDLKRAPELLSAKVHIERLLMVPEDSRATGRPRDWRIQLLHKRPKTFAVMAVVEVLGWWSAQGADLKKAYFLLVPMPTTASFLTSCQPRIKRLIRASPRRDELSSSIEPILAAIINGEKAPIPRHSKSLLYGPLIHDNRRCGMCQKKASDVGHDLLRCGGGCGGLEHYCCKEHQLADWKNHKFFCQGNGAVSPQAL